MRIWKDIELNTTIVLEEGVNLFDIVDCDAIDDYEFLFDDGYRSFNISN